jgi:hypothetical protein
MKLGQAPLHVLGTSGIADRETQRVRALEAVARFGMAAAHLTHLTERG